MSWPTAKIADQDRGPQDVRDHEHEPPVEPVDVDAGERREQRPTARGTSGTGR